VEEQELGGQHGEGPLADFLGKNAPFLKKKKRKKESSREANNKEKKIFGEKN